MVCQSCGVPVAGAFCPKCGAPNPQLSQPSASPSAYAAPPAIPTVDARERLGRVDGGALQHGNPAATLAQQGLGAIPGRMGKVALGATCLLWIAWFFLPSATLSGRMVQARSYSFWTLIGVNFNHLPMNGTRSSHGLFSIIGLLAIAAPIAAPFIQTSWARYLNGAPLAYILVSLIVIYINENSVFGVMAKEEGANPFSFGRGIFVLTVAAVILAAGALKTRKVYSRDKSVRRSARSW